MALLYLWLFRIKNVPIVIFHIYTLSPEHKERAEKYRDVLLSSFGLCKCPISDNLVILPYLSRPSGILFAFLWRAFSGCACKGSKGFRIGRFLDCLRRLGFMTALDRRERPELGAE